MADVLAHLSVQTFGPQSSCTFNTLYLICVYTHACTHLENNSATGLFFKLNNLGAFVYSLMYNSGQLTPSGAQNVEK